MRYFSEVIRILEQFREKKIELADAEALNDNNSRIGELYNGIRSGRIDSDTAASRTLYGIATPDTRYSTLKSRLKRRLLNSLLHLDLKKAGYSEYYQAQYRVRKRLFMINTLIALGARATGIRLARAAMKDGRRYHFTSEVLELASILRYNASLTGADEEFMINNTLVHESLDTLQAELLSAEYYQGAVRNFAKLNPTPEFAAELDRQLSEIRPLFECYGSFNLALSYFRLGSLAYSFSRDFSATVASCNAAINYLSENPHLASNTRLAEFAITKLEAYVMLRNYEEGKAAAEACAVYLKPGTNVWFAFEANHFFLLMHTEHFIEADELFNRVTTNTRFSALPEIWKERWKIYELYLIYALRSLPDHASSQTAKKFDLKSFLKFVPVAAKDKHGMHVAVLIAHILYMLEAGDFSGIIERMEALKTYRSRYLRTSSIRRSSLFFRLLTIMENNSFSYTLTKAKSEIYFRRMLQTSAEEAETDEELQVIPYEWLWRRVLDTLRDYELKHGYGRKSLSSGI